MALIIKGNMPKIGCTLCFAKRYVEHPFCNLCNITGAEITEHVCAFTRPSDCPILGEIPDEHGDLIERSPLVQKIKDEWQKIHEETGYDVKGIFWNKLVEIIESSKVVLEAST